MAKQTFTTGQVLTAAQMTSLQQTAMLGGAASAKTASYTLVAADAGTAISMSNAVATTITVNTGLFAAGDTVQITNLGAGVCTITAGTATVNTASSLVLAQYESGTLDFTSASAAVFIKAAGAAGSSGKVLQVVVGTSTTSVSNSTSTYADTGLTATITPASTGSRILVLVDHGTVFKSSGNANNQLNFRLFRGATQLVFSSSWYTGTALNLKGYHGIQYVDSPASISALTYKTQFRCENNTASVDVIAGGAEATTGSIILIEIGA
jgi:hypothetical protein